MESCELWLTSANGAHVQHIGAHIIASEYGNDYCRGLPFMHAISGCDTSQLSDVNEARKYLFFYCNQKLENIPPSCAALLQHVKRAAQKSEYTWSQTLEANPTLPSPSEWGWKLDSERIWDPLWSTLPEASKGFRELIKDACKNGAQEDASVLKQASRVHSCVVVVDSVQTWTVSLITFFFLKVVIQFQLISSSLELYQ
jgi:hypothetical protein